jgi:nucleotide-binding universal stress UspA family protein
MNRILIPIDFSSSSGNALRYAHALSIHLGMRLTLLNCYPYEDSIRPYDFGEKEYRIGVREMLIAFYKKYADEPKDNTLFIAQPGSILDKVVFISPQYNLVVLSGNKFDSPISRWAGSKSSSIASMAQCPVLLVPTLANFSKWEKIWHIKRKTVEASAFEKHFAHLKINPAKIETKSFDQTSFSSALWKSFIGYIKKPDEDFREAISANINTENIDLMMLVSHNKDSFRSFVNDYTMQIIFQFNIPVLTFQKVSTPENTDIKL